MQKDLIVRTPKSKCYLSKDSNQGVIPTAGEVFASCILYRAGYESKLIYEAFSESTYQGSLLYLSLLF